MPPLKTIKGVKKVLVGSTECFFVTYSNVDGPDSGHVFPGDTLAWRSTELGIDPADSDQLIDIILHEPFIPPEAADRIVIKPGASRKAARQAHLARIAAAKAAVTIEGQSARAATGGHLRIIHDHVVHPDRVRDIQRAVNGAAAPLGLPVDESALRRDRELQEGTDR